MCFIKGRDIEDEKDGARSNSDPELKEFLSNGDTKENFSADITSDVTFEYLESIKSDPKARK